MCKSCKLFSGGFHSGRVALGNQHPLHCGAAPSGSVNSIHNLSGLGASVQFRLMKWLLEHCWGAGHWTWEWWGNQQSGSCSIMSRSPPWLYLEDRLVLLWAWLGKPRRNLLSLPSMSLLPSNLVWWEAKEGQVTAPCFPVLPVFLFLSRT